MRWRFSTRAVHGRTLSTSRRNCATNGGAAPTCSMCGTGLKVNCTMPEHVDFDNPTRKDLLRFRKKLHHALLFEPVVDLDFNRPAAKLGSLVQESQALMQRLKQIWDRYDSLLACLTRIVAILEPLEPVMEPILTIGFTPPRLAHFRDAVRMPGLSSEEWERRHALHEKRERLRTLAQQLSTQYRSSLHPADEIMRVQVAMSQINGGRFWLFLAQVTQRVSNGTSHVFEQH